MLLENIIRLHSKDINLSSKCLLPNINFSITDLFSYIRLYRFTVTRIYIKQTNSIFQEM